MREYWSGLPCPQGVFPDQESNVWLLLLSAMARGFLTAEQPGEPMLVKLDCFAERERTEETLINMLGLYSKRLSSCGTLLNFSTRIYSVLCEVHALKGDVLIMLPGSYT